MVVRSQNGWKAGVDIATYSAGGARFPVRKGSAATVLMYVAARFAAEVEKLDPGECYGYAYRKIRGSSSSVSNHASGTAIDLNSSKHWLGDVGTFSAAKRKAIAKILDDCEGCIRWGGNYHGRKDEMHFEVNVGATRLRKLAKKIKAGKKPKAGKAAKAEPLPKVTVHYPLTVDGKQGAQTKAALRVALGLSSVSAFGPVTKKALQKKLGVTVDGVIGKKTVKALQKKVGAKADGVWGAGTTRALQKWLNKRKKF